MLRFCWNYSPSPLRFGFPHLPNHTSTALELRSQGKLLILGRLGFKVLGFNGNPFPQSSFESLGVKILRSNANPSPHSWWLRALGSKSFAFYGFTIVPTTSDF
jgi:hypothetical protein